MDVMQPIYLISDELDYELRIRNCVTGRKTAVQKRKILNRLLEKDRVSPKVNIYAYVDPNFDFAIEKEIINNSLESLCTLIIDFEGGPITDSSFKRIKTRLIHISDRVKRIPINAEDVDEISTFKNESYATCLELEADLYTKVTNTEINPEIEKVDINQPSTSGQSNNVVSNVNFKYYPIHKWGVKFDGKSNSLYSFLEEVKELSQSRRVTETELFNSAHELFSGPALLWLRQNKKTAADWSSLVEKLKHFYLPKDPETQIWEQIKVRLQGKGEPAHIFIAIMETLFSRLSREPAEVTKVKYIRRNLLSKYHDKLPLIGVDSISILLELCRTIEEDEIVRNQAHFPTRSISCLDPELAYVGSSSTLTSTSNVEGSQFKNKRPSSKNVKNNKVYTITCWNCKGSGHSYRNCSSKPSKFCFKCGTPNCTLKTCQNCSKN